MEIGSIWPEHHTRVNSFCIADDCLCCSTFIAKCKQSYQPLYEKMLKNLRVIPVHFREKFTLGVLQACVYTLCVVDPRRERLAYALAGVWITSGLMFSHHHKTAPEWLALLGLLNRNRLVLALKGHTQPSGAHISSVSIKWNKCFHKVWVASTGQHITVVRR